MSTPTTRMERHTTDAHIHKEGRHVQEMPDGDLIGHGEAKERIYRRLLKKPDAALVKDGERSRLLKDEGMDYRLTGRYTCENKKLDSTRRVQTLWGWYLKWEGDRWTKYDFEVSVRPHGYY
ncbi:predicted protein [Aspergillus terreus NIH2624]|uniref:Uncharacterized protein n=1 Tax=Aspergillus terreus (strain NIH 2624 / FGSC A1156) TaxID=341663 RepID=Q0CZ46_ASPTN|nr:uncharacterized protein ATEG_01038 [Aspergillus terreus NIH2624]EAU37795.1 predicted protein [Aspergillus terreus NIH2624]